MNLTEHLFDLLGRINLHKDDRILDQAAINSIGNQVLIDPPAPSLIGYTPYPGAAIDTTNNYNSKIILAPQAINHSNPGMITITLAPPIFEGIQLTGLGSNPDNPIIELRARIEWGSGGYSNTADVDWIDGSFITVLGSFVRVSAVYAINRVSVSTPNPRINVGVSLSEGTRGADEVGPTYSISQIALALNANNGFDAVGGPIAAGSTTNAILFPPFSKSVRVFIFEDPINPLILNPITITIVDTLGNPIAVWQQINLNPPPTIPLHGQGIGIRISNPATNPAGIQIGLVFGLAL